MSMMSCQTSYSWVQLCTKPKYMWVWQASKPNIIGFSYASNSSTYRSGELSDLTSLDSTTCWAWVHIDLTSCQTIITLVHHSKSKWGMKLTIVISLMLGYEALFVYFYNFNIYLSLINVITRIWHSNLSIQVKYDKVRGLYIPHEPPR
jgi:hypothetical protein